MLFYYYSFLGELLGEINYIIIIFPEYDTHCHFISFLVSIFIGLATQAKSLINLL